MDTDSSAFADVDALAKGTAKTQILNLATPHLRYLDKRFHPELLDNLIACLQRFSPAVIAVESLPPFLIAAMETGQGHYTEILEMFAAERLRLGHHAQRLLSVTPSEAEARANEQLHTLALGKQGDTDRAELILLLLAAYDLYAALLQWQAVSKQAMSKQARASHHDIPADIAQELDAELANSDERITIALRLATALGHPTLAYIDDHQDAALYFAMAERLEPELDASNHHELLEQSKVRATSGQLFENAMEQGDLLSYYRHVNSRAFAREIVNVECGVYLQTRLPSGLDRARMAQWEVRNLNMAARIRQTSARHAGKNILTITGSSHKPMLDRYLSQMIDVELVQLHDLCGLVAA